MSQLSPSPSKLQTVREIRNDIDYIAAIANSGDSLVTLMQVVVEFSAIWTPASTSVSTFIESMAEEFPEVVFLRCDIDRCAVRLK